MAQNFRSREGRSQGVSEAESCGANRQVSNYIEREKMVDTLKMIE